MGYRYPQLGIVTANELHLPVSDPARPRPTFLTLLSADTDHSFWVPQLGGKTDLIPNRINRMWTDPDRTGLFLGQCAQYCGTQHGKMLQRVSVDSAEDFEAWVKVQQQPAVEDPEASAGRRVFETTACINCHTIRGTAANGQFGPDLTHLMSRATIASGAAAEHAGQTSSVARESGRDQTGLVDAGHETERRRAGRTRPVHADAALNRGTQEASLVVGHGRYPQPSD